MIGVADAHEAVRVVEPAVFGSEVYLRTVRLLIFSPIFKHIGFAEGDLRFRLDRKRQGVADKTRNIKIGKEIRSLRIQSDTERTARRTVFKKSQRRLLCRGIDRENQIFFFDGECHRRAPFQMLKFTLL